MSRPLDFRAAAARPLADAPVPRRPVRDGGSPAVAHPAALAALAARTAAWRVGPAASDAVPPDVELSVRVLADGGTIAVARQVVDGRVRHIEAVVR